MCFCLMAWTLSTVATYFLLRNFFTQNPNILSNVLEVGDKFQTMLHLFTMDCISSLC